MFEQYIHKILSARVYDVAIESPLEVANYLSCHLKNRILLKREDLQPVFSFKCRGAYNKIAHLVDEEQVQAVITASAGNHAQGVALAAQRLGIEATIVMPSTTPSIKVKSVKNLGAKVVLYGDTFDEAFAHSQRLSDQLGVAYVHPYDDPEVIAGQGTIGMELLRQCQNQPKAIFVPVGGGGLIAGVTAYVKYLCPSIQVIGVEAEDSACLKAALEAGERVVLPEVGLFADGVAVAQIGYHTFEVVKDAVDKVVTVTTDEICAAIKDIFQDTRSISEPAGALAVAGMKKYIEHTRMQAQTCIAIVSGANINFDRLRNISERTELGERREAIFAAAITEKPGSFLNFCKALGRLSITEFNYRYANSAKAQVYVGVAMEDAQQDLQPLLEKLKQQGFETLNMTDNETAKLHIRHMVGGKAPQVKQELLFRFEFPERPGALLRFLTRLGQKWNITLFHYRNHGAAYGRVLVGLEVSDDVSDKEALSLALNKLGYRFWEETHNDAYRLFLSNVT